MRWACLLCLLLLPAGWTAVAQEAAEPGATAPASADTAAIAAPPPPFTAPTGVSAKDTPNDGGESIRVRWRPVTGATSYRIERAGEGEEFQPVGTATARESFYDDGGLTDGTAFRYRVVALGPDGAEGTSAATLPALSKPQWFNGELTGVAIAVIGFILVVAWFIRRARRGEQLFVRRIAGLEAVDEAVGRATEMGRAVLYVPGTGRIEDIATVASMNILGEIAKKTAQFGTPILVPNRDPVVFTVSREVVKGAYTAAGRPDAFDPKSVFFIVENALAFAAAVDGIMVREKPATNFLLGSFYAESLILAEVGASTGAIQIAGTDQVPQLPFFVVACDYTLMGEELYAASAYLSREPLSLGALKGQDVGKMVFMVLLLAGSLAALLFGLDAGWVLRTTGY
jgi:hypothetical protein